jgi:hypothetical protein
MKSEYGFQEIDASRTVRRVAADLRRSVARAIDDEATGTAPAKESSKTETQEEAPAAKPALKLSSDKAKTE